MTSEEAEMAEWNSQNQEKHIKKLENTIGNLEAILMDVECPKCGCKMEYCETMGWICKEIGETTDL